MLTDLPLELLERIVDRLRPAKWPSCSAKEDIKSVTLVCRRFRHTGQSYLFRDVVYTFRYASMDAQWEADASLQPWNPEWERRGDYPCKALSMLSSFLHDNPSFGLMIRRLRLVAYPEHNEDIIESDYGDSIHFRDSDVVDISHWCRLLACTSLLEDLEVADIKLRSSPEFWASYDKPLPSLNRLLIEYPYYTPNSDSCITEILGCFGSIKVVSVFNSDLAELPAESYSPCSVHIREFSLLDDTRTTGQLYQFLLRSPSAHTLRSLDPAFVPPSTTAPVELSNLMRAVGPSLNHFACHLTPRYNTQAERDFIVPDLSTCANLHSLTLRIYSSPEESAEVVWARCVQMLSLCHGCRQMQTVTIALTLAYDFPGWWGDSAELMQRLEEAVLGLARRTSLSHLVFTSGTRTALRIDIQEDILKCMPCLVKKGILSFEQFRTPLNRLSRFD